MGPKIPAMMYSHLRLSSVGKGSMIAKGVDSCFAGSILASEKAGHGQNADNSALPGIFRPFVGRWEAALKW
jgi:hypothetical protein